MSLPQHRMAEWMHKLEKAADSRYPPAEELEEEAVPALDQTRMSEDGCPHAPPDESYLPTWEGTAGLAVQTITARAEKELAALLCGTGLRFSLKVVIDGEQNGSRRLFAASAGTLTPPAQTYRPDGAVVGRLKEFKEFKRQHATAPLDRCLCGGVGCNSCEPRGG